MLLTIPAKVVNVRNTDNTFKVSNPNEALGDVQPIPKPGQLGQAAPKKGGGCGGVGQNILMVVAIAVSAVVAPLAVSALSGGAVSFGAAGTGAGAGTLLAGAAIGAAVGSAASHGLGVITGLQDKGARSRRSGDLWPFSPPDATTVID